MLGIKQSCVITKLGQNCNIYETYVNLNIVDVTRDNVSSGYPNTEKGVKNTTCSGVFLTKFEVFGIDLPLLCRYS